MSPLRRCRTTSNVPEVTCAAVVATIQSFAALMMRAYAPSISTATLAPTPGPAIESTVPPDTEPNVGVSVYRPPGGSTICGTVGGGTGPGTVGDVVGGTVAAVVVGASVVGGRV